MNFHPVAFESRKLTKRERSYPSHLLQVELRAGSRRGLISSTGLSSCAGTTRACNGYSSSAMYVTARGPGLGTVAQFARQVPVPCLTHPCPDSFPGRRLPGVLTRKCFPDCSGAGSGTSYYEPDSDLAEVTTSPTRIWNSSPLHPEACMGHGLRPYQRRSRCDSRSPSLSSRRLRFGLAGGPS